MKLPTLLFLALLLSSTLVISVPIEDEQQVNSSTKSHGLLECAIDCFHQCGLHKHCLLKCGKVCFKAEIQCEEKCFGKCGVTDRACLVSCSESCLFETNVA